MPLGSPSPVNSRKKQFRIWSTAAVAMLLLGLLWLAPAVNAAGGARLNVGGQQPSVQLVCQAFAVLNETVPCVPTVTGGGPPPTGTVEISGGPGEYPSGHQCPIENNGSCLLFFRPTTPIGTAERDLIATYQGDNNYATGQGFTKLIIVRPTTLTPNCSPGNPKAGQTVTCTFTVTDQSGATKQIAPSGTISVSTGAPGTFPLGTTCSPTAINGVSSTCTFTYKPSRYGNGAHVITAHYSSSVTNFSSSSTSVVLNPRRETATALACTPSAPIDGDVRCTFTATDLTAGESPAPLHTVPSGEVTLSSSATGTFDRPTCTLTGTEGVASCEFHYTPKASSPTAHTITAAYPDQLDREGGRASAVVVVQGGDVHY